MVKIEEKAKELRRIRMHLGFSMKEFAQLFSVNVNTYKKMETGERPFQKDFQERYDSFLADRFMLPTSKLEAKIDYLRIRLKTTDYKTIIDKLLQLGDKPFYKENKGRYAYKGLVSFSEINVYFSEDMNMGTLIEMAGKGCRAFEWYMVHEQGRDWESFLLSCYQYALAFTKTAEEADKFLKVTRFDIALDELYSTKGNYDLEKLKEKHDKGLLRTKSDRFRYVDGKMGKNSKGKSLYFGSIHSPIVLNFYEKDLEQADKLDVPVEFVHSEYGFKNRYEVRLMGDYSNSFVKKWIYEFDGYNLADKAVSLINDKIHVYKEIEGGLALDDEWYSLMGSYGSFQFQMYPKQYEVGIKEYRWYEQGGPSSTRKFLLELEKIRGGDNYSRIKNIDENVELSDKQKAILEYERQRVADEKESIVRRISATD
ncbi:replication initiation factor domain-containing protein [Streptococcus acidominimus]|uniref:Replication initiation factor domain-containing protein n=1 Tax=Streptococcus acidominimus TaxID=1326 RepID=A0A4Y9FRM1_STRAI|nr:replication initiation factor domain-containing protein [Streptococcus acidominimus]MBF0817865.1 replication initiation factor domain-containing protein [Streptococcus acidominimus]MBF0838381.1 replication initiation factor domain-containing protein [Streptococcus acidominimus]MBF0846256.1 replication initiation factor domain-containing protein [Streptococcus danieliae]TFU31854.1 replication initiation factor domain-containing protein [Streptococcus acidominimus]